MNLADIHIGENAPDIVRAVIEIAPKSRNKYLYDLDLEIFRLKRVLHGAVQYPTAYGFIPQTSWDDDEPLDVMVMCDEPFTPGVLLLVRPIGLLAMKDETIMDSKILAVPEKDPRYADIKDISHVPAHLLKEIEHFFETYKILENKHVESFGWSTADFARHAITTGMNTYHAGKSWEEKESIAREARNLSSTVESK